VRWNVDTATSAGRQASVHSSIVTEQPVRSPFPCINVPCSMHAHLNLQAMLICRAVPIYGGQSRYMLMEGT
jgi:hypothetical protein